MITPTRPNSMRLCHLHVSIQSPRPFSSLLMFLFVRTRMLPTVCRCRRALSSDWRGPSALVAHAWNVRPSLFVEDGIETDLLFTAGISNRRLVYILTCGYSGVNPPTPCLILWFFLLPFFFPPFHSFPRVYGAGETERKSFCLSHCYIAQRERRKKKDDAHLCFILFYFTLFLTCVV